MFDADTSSLFWDADGAGDGTGAIRSFEAEQPDLVLLDINMPGASGFHVCEAIRAIMIAAGRKLPCRFEISQGEYADRPSTLLLEIDGAGRIFVSGDVIELARGTLRV